MSQAVRVSEFFRYHGMWAPGIRLFRKVSFSVKAALISLVFVVPLSWVSWQYFNDKAAAIDFSAKEHDGVQYAQALLPVLSAVHKGEDSSSAMESLRKLDQTVGAELGTTQAFQTVLETEPGSVDALLGLAAMAIEKNVAWGRRLSAPLGVALLAGAAVLAATHLWGAAPVA